MSPAMLEDTVLDNGLGPILDTLTSHIFICQAEPTTYALASTTALLGTKSWGAGAAFGAPAAGTSPTGRKVTSVAITDGTITTTGTASWWAACGTASLHAHGLLSAPQAVTAGNTFSLAAFEIRLANQ
jgi:hypothetical protein